MIFSLFTQRVSIAHVSEVLILAFVYIELRTGYSFSEGRVRSVFAIQTLSPYFVGPHFATACGTKHTAPLMIINNGGVHYELGLQYIIKRLTRLMEGC